jgi:hypothetical protein
LCCAPHLLDARLERVTQSFRASANESAALCQRGKPYNLPRHSFDDFIPAPVRVFAANVSAWKAQRAAAYWIARAPCPVY